jgi:hypothetical protein
MAAASRDRDARHRPAVAAAPFLRVLDEAPRPAHRRPATYVTVPILSIADRFCISPETARIDGCITMCSRAPAAARFLSAEKRRRCSTGVPVEHERRRAVQDSMVCSVWSCTARCLDIYSVRLALGSLGHHPVVAMKLERHAKRHGRRRQPRPSRPGAWLDRWSVRIRVS